MLNQVSQFLSNNVHFTSTDTEQYILGHLQDGLSWLTGKISTWAPRWWWALATWLRASSAS